MKDNRYKTFKMSVILKISMKTELENLLEKGLEQRDVSLRRPVFQYEIEAAASVDDVFNSKTVEEYKKELEKAREYSREYSLLLSLFPKAAGLTDSQIAVQDELKHYSTRSCCAFGIEVKYIVDVKDPAKIAEEISEKDLTWETVLLAKEGRMAVVDVDRKQNKVDVYLPEVGFDGIEALEEINTRVYSPENVCSAVLCVIDRQG